MGSHVFVSHAWPGSGMVLSMMAYFTGVVMLGAFGECLSAAHLDVLPNLNWHWRIVSSPGCHYMPSHSIAICVRIIAAGCKRRKYGNTKSQGCKVKVVLSKLLMLDDAPEGVHISKQSLRQSIHQHHDRHVRRRCISMTLSRWQVVTPRHAAPRGAGTPRGAAATHLTVRYCNPFINIMTEMWNAGAFEWRCRARVSRVVIINIMTEMWDTRALEWRCREWLYCHRMPSGNGSKNMDYIWNHISKQSLRQSTHQHHDRDVRRRCISMTLSRMTFCIVQDPTRSD